MATITVERVLCPYCGAVAEFVGGDAVYPHRADLFDRRFYLCRACNAYVGTHKGTTKPLGRLANLELRDAKVAAHAAFDPLWKGQPTKARSQAYRWLAVLLGIPASQCHIGMFNVEQCRRVVALCSERTLESGRTAVAVVAGSGELVQSDHARKVL